MLNVYPAGRYCTVTPKSLDAASRELNQLFTDFWKSVQGADGDALVWKTPADFYEAGDSLYLEADLPGVKREDIEITLEKNVLKVAAERKPAEGERTFWHKERGFGRVERAIKLPDSVDPDSIAAELRDGVLYLTLQKKPELQPKRIEVKG